MLTKLAGAIEQVAMALNKAVGGYDSRVRQGLIGTGDNLVETLTPCIKDIQDARAKKLVKHYVKQWKANRKKLD